MISTSIAPQLVRPQSNCQDRFFLCEEEAGMDDAAIAAPILAGDHEDGEDVEEGMEP